MSSNNPHSGHRARLRKRFLDTGIVGFSDHEVLELLLFNSIPRANTNPIAHDLINKYGSIAGVLFAPADELETVKGIGASSAALLSLVGSIVKMLSERMDNSVQADYSAHLKKFFDSSNAGDFIMLFADSALGVINSRCGKTADLLSGRTTVRELIADVLLADARAVIIGISHGESLPLPANEDHSLIKTISTPLKDIDTVLTDVVIYGCGRTYSLREKSPFILQK
ncbi:MAG: hypothetical protein IKP25_02330 [Ruminococcus sp.]|nr:hypothetical protein [Ruminococcus sp.]